MVNLTTTYSNQNLNESMLQELELDIKVTNNPFNFKLGDLFLVGARKNPKRNFLFVSKLIGKHISVKPQIPLLTGQLLATMFADKNGVTTTVKQRLLAQSLKGELDVKGIYDSVGQNKIDLPKPTLILGFAETATGLGHSVFQSFGENAHYIHTTREEVLDLVSSFNFEEEHSHATSHMCYGMEKNYFDKFDHILLVDDEVTTGNTALNLIQSLNENFPNKQYSVLSILDWRQEQDIRRLEEAKRDLNLEIDFVSFVSGEVTYTNKELQYPEPEYTPTPNEHIYVYDHLLSVPETECRHYLSKSEQGDVMLKSYHSHTGRFGLDYAKQRQLDRFIENSGDFLKEKRQAKTTLCLGTGEFMHIPCAMASHMGDNVLYHSTTRSPIHIKKDSDYPVKEAIPYRDEYNPSVKFFIYNVEPNKYKELFFFTEQEVSQNEKDYLSHALVQMGVEHLHFVSFDYEFQV